VKVTGGGGLATSIPTRIAPDVKARAKWRTRRITMSKGDNKRPSSISKEKYDANFEAAFGKKELRTWEDAPGSERGDQSSGRSPDSDRAGRQELQGQDGKHNPEAPEPVEGKACPGCGSKGGYFQCFICRRGLP
jgi:hypothetical protein